MENTEKITTELSFSEFLGLIGVLDESMYPGATRLSDRIASLKISSEQIETLKKWIEQGG